VADIRTSRRFPVHLPTKVLSEKESTDGLTENISAAGVYLLIDGGMEVGASAEFEITVPGETVGADGDVRLRCKGRVVRCDQEAQPGRSGIACVIEKYEILRAGQTPGADSEDGGE
jgi:hypothetical protein